MIEFDVAEVLEYDHTYQYVPAGTAHSNTNKLFSVKARTISKYYDDETILAKPANINIKQIPLVGEYILIYRTINQISTAKRRREQWYYLGTVDLQSSMNENMLPGISRDITQKEIDDVKPGLTFERASISPLQPYEGDTLIEGRFGNSIRLGSTVPYTKGRYSVAGTWLGQTVGDPIIVISNGHKNNPNKQFTVESFKTDAASLYLTSTQQLSDFVLNNKLSIGTSESAFKKSQLVGSADRIILKAKTDVVALDSQKGIELLAPKVKIGIGPYEPMLQSDATVDVIRKIIQVIQSGFVDSSGAISTPINQALASIDLSKLKSKTIEIDKWRNR